MNTKDREKISSPTKALKPIKQKLNVLKILDDRASSAEVCS